METFLGQWVFDALHHGLVYLASRRRDTETIGGGQLLIEFLGLMAVVWCDRFVFLTIYREANQEKQDKEEEEEDCFMQNTSLICARTRIIDGDQLFKGKKYIIETIGGGQLLIEFLGLMTVVWCDPFVFSDIG